MQVPRCFRELDGAVSMGKIIVDNPVDPKWAIVQEAVDGCLYLGGSIDAFSLTEVFAALLQEGDVLVGMLPSDPRIQYLPPDPAYDGLALEFYDRPIGQGLEPYLRQVPSDCTIKRLDRHLIMRTEWGPNDVAFYGGFDIWEKICFGYCLMRGDEILSEATVGPPGLGLYEPGLFTQKDYRGKGYGTMVVARLIQEIEATGGRTYWNCAKQNMASVAVARKLGYRTQKEYRCMLWNKVDAAVHRPGVDRGGGTAGVERDQ
jgi:RimJ/RimL family protein N-acetyltransferase